MNDGSGAVTTAVENLQTRITVGLNDHWQLVAVVLAGIVVAAVGYVGVRRRRRRTRH